MIKPAGW